MLTDGATFVISPWHSFSGGSSQGACLSETGLNDPKHKRWSEHFRALRYSAKYKLVAPALLGTMLYLLDYLW